MADGTIPTSARSFESVQITLPQPDPTAADEKRNAARDEARQKAAKALDKAEQNSIDQQRPTPKTSAPKLPTRPGDVAKPAEPSPQPDASKDKDPQAAARAREAAETADHEVRKQAAVYREQLEQPIQPKAAQPATPKAPTQAAKLGGEGGIKKDGDGKEGDPKGVADAKTDSGKPSALTKADAKTPEKKTGEGSVAKGGGKQVAGEVEGGPKTKSYEGLLSGRPGNPETKLSAGYEKPIATPVPLSAGVVKGTAPQPAKPEGFFAKLATALQKALGQQLPTAPKHTPALAKGGKPESGKPQASLSQSTPAKTHQLATAKSSGTPTAPEGQKGPEKLVKTFLTSESPHDVEAREHLLAQVLLYGQKILGGGKSPLPTTVNAAAAQVAFREGVKGKNGGLDKTADGEKEVAGKEGDSGKEADLQRSYLVNRHRDRRSA